jgi:hypothetical protein
MFGMISLDKSGNVVQDFAYRSFLEAANSPGKESLDGIYYRSMG